MLTNTNIFVVRLQRTIFFYLPPFPLQWNSDFTRLGILLPMTTWIPWFILFVEALFTGFAGISVILWFVIVPQQQPKLERFKLGIFFLAGLTALLVFIITFHLFKNRHQFLLGFNFIVQLEKVLIQFYYKVPLSVQDFKELVKAGTHSELLQLLVLICAGGAPLVGMMIALFFDMDPYNYILEIFFHGNAYHRGQIEIAIGCGIRAICIYPAMAETIRSFIVAAEYAILLVDSVFTIIHIFERKVKHVRNFYKLYNLLTILYRTFEAYINNMLYLCINLPFWFLVISMWINIKGRGKIDVTISLCSILVSVIILLGIVLIVPRCMQVLATLSRLPRENRQAARNNWVIKRKTRLAKIEMLEAILPCFL